MLAAGPGCHIAIRTAGRQAEDAARALDALVRDGLGERDAEAAVALHLPDLGHAELDAVVATRRRLRAIITRSSYGIVVVVFDVVVVVAVADALGASRGPRAGRPGACPC